uniref:t-SNARE coiled-coil homology domain-containing protein n=3 Tax=Parascaris univalens TaxID=6257 RepID=A0A914ZPI4_PARUN
MSELPLTVTRRRIGANSSALTEYSPEDNKKQQHPYSSPFSSFSTLSSSLWSSAQHTLSAVSSAPLLSRVDLPSTQSSNSLNSSSYIPSIPFEMPQRDRTGEFRTTAKSYQMKFQANGLLPHGQRNNLVQQSVQFNQLAKRIGRDLSRTCAKMEKLTELAKRRSLFDDRIVEVEELSQMIKQDITGLNKQIAALQVFSKGNGVGASKEQGRGHSQLVVVGLQSKLASVSKDFQNVLQLRTENLKQQKWRREKFSQCQPVPSTLPPSVSNGNLGSVLLQDDVNASSSVAVDMDHLEKHRMQQQISLIDEQDAYVQARSSAMENIESSISELGQIFRQLASLVSEQGEMITRIDSNVEETSMNVEAAHTELVKYFHSISQNRWLMIKVFGVLIIFLIIFIIFLT